MSREELLQQIGVLTDDELIIILMCRRNNLNSADITIYGAAVKAVGYSPSAIIKKISERNDTNP